MASRLLVLCGLTLLAGCVEDAPPWGWSNWQPPVCQDGPNCCEEAEVTCVGDPDKGLVCRCHRSWACDDVILPTAADLSPDGKRLAVLTVVSLWVFERPPEGDRWLSRPSRKLALPRERTLQAEGVTWDDDETIRICNEQGDLFTIPLSSVPGVR